MAITEQEMRYLDSTDSITFAAAIEIRRLRAELAALKAPVYIYRCPVCGAEFEYDNKEHPSGLLCTACTGTMKGCLQKLRLYDKSAAAYLRQQLAEANAAREMLEKALQTALVELAEVVSFAEEEACPLGKAEIDSINQVVAKGKQALGGKDIHKE